MYHCYESKEIFCLFFYISSYTLIIFYLAVEGLQCFNCQGFTNDFADDCHYPTKEMTSVRECEKDMMCEVNKQTSKQICGQFQGGRHMMCKVKEQTIKQTNKQIYKQADMTSVRMCDKNMMCEINKQTNKQTCLQAIR